MSSRRVVSVVNRRLTLYKQEFMGAFFGSFGEPNWSLLYAARALRARGLKVAALTNNFSTMGEEEGEGEEGVSITGAPASFNLFDVVVESSKEGMRKPDPAIYELACSRLGVEARHCVFLDDIGYNLKPARAMGMQTIRVRLAREREALDELEALVGFRLYCRGGGGGGGGGRGKSDLDLPVTLAVPCGHGGGVITVDAWGDAAARPVLLLHGGGQTRHAWSKTAAALSRGGYFCVAADLKGHGDSYWDPRARERMEREEREVGERGGVGGSGAARYEFGKGTAEEQDPYSLECFAADADRLVAALSLAHPARMKRGEGPVLVGASLGG